MMMMVLVMTFVVAVEDLMKMAEIQMMDVNANHPNLLMNSTKMNLIDADVAAPDAVDVAVIAGVVVAVVVALVVVAAVLSLYASLSHCSIPSFAVPTHPLAMLYFHSMILLMQLRRSKMSKEMMRLMMLK